MIGPLSPGLEVLLKYNTQSAITSQLSDETTLDSSELNGLLTEPRTPVSAAAIASSQNKVGLNERMAKRLTLDREPVKYTYATITVAYSFGPC